MRSKERFKPRSLLRELLKQGSRQIVVLLHGNCSTAVSKSADRVWVRVRVRVRVRVGFSIKLELG